MTTKLKFSIVLIAALLITVSLLSVTSETAETTNTSSIIDYPTTYS